MSWQMGMRYQDGIIVRTEYSTNLEMRSNGVPWRREMLGHKQITMVTLEEPSSLLQCVDHSGRPGMKVHPRLFLRA